MRMFFRYEYLEDSRKEDNVKSSIIIDKESFNPEGFEDIYDLLTKEEKLDNNITITNSSLILNRKDSIENALKLPYVVVGNANFQEFRIQINTAELEGTSLGDITEIPDSLCRNGKYNSLADITALELLTFSILKNINQKLKYSGTDKIRFFVVEGVEQRLGKAMLQDLKLMLYQTGIARGYLLTVNSALGGLLIKVITDYNLKKEEVQYLLQSKISKETILFDVAKLDFEFLHEAVILNLNKTKVAKFSKALRVKLIESKDKYTINHSKAELLKLYIYSVYLLCAPLLDNFNVNLTVNNMSKTKFYDLNKLLSKIYVFEPYEEVDNTIYPAFRAIVDDNDSYDLSEFIYKVMELSDTALKSFRDGTDLYTVMYNITTKDFLNVMRSEVEMPSDYRKEKIDNTKNEKPIAHIGDGNYARDEVAATNFGTHHNDLSNSRERTKREKLHDTNNKYGVSSKASKGAKGVFKGTSFLGKGVFSGLSKGLKFANKNKKDTLFTLIFIIAIVFLYFMFKRI